MSKMSDLLKKALDKKKGVRHMENDGVAETKVKKIKTAPPVGKKPPTKSAGRGR